MTLYARVFAALFLASALSLVPAPAPVADAAVPAATCAKSEGPGIPAPVGLPAGVPGFHAQWYGQSGYPTLCPGDRSTATVAYYNSGSLGWGGGRRRRGAAPGPPGS